MKYVNLGCGSRYHVDWINIDIVPSGPTVVVYDLRQGIPLANDSYDVVYHSHLLEHIRRPDALRFMKECYRILRPGGVLRVAVPDLEQICRAYLEKLEATLKRDVNGDCDYDWMLLEMYDQTVREQSGGEMLTYLSQSPLRNELFIYERIGEEGRQLVRVLREHASKAATDNGKAASPGGSLWRQRLRALQRGARETLLKRLLGSQGLRAFEIGRFREDGEIHHWMYDRYSLARLMLAAGFINPVRQTATRSQISDWFAFNLDTKEDGTVNKPDSIFMEANKPTE